MQWARDYDILYYVAVVGVDAAGNTGHVSNIVTMMVPSLGGVLMICLLCIVYIVISDPGGRTLTTDFTIKPSPIRHMMGPVRGRSKEDCQEPGEQSSQHYNFDWGRGDGGRRIGVACHQQLVQLQQRERKWL